jgi:hypothetical protein
MRKLVHPQGWMLIGMTDGAIFSTVGLSSLLEPWPLSGVHLRTCRCPGIRRLKPLKDSDCSPVSFNTQVRFPQIRSSSVAMSQGIGISRLRSRNLRSRNRQGDPAGRWSGLGKSDLVFEPGPASIVSASTIVSGQGVHNTGRPMSADRDQRGD